MTKSPSENTNSNKQNLHSISSEADRLHTGDLCNQPVDAKLTITVAHADPKPKGGRTFVPAVKQSPFVSTNMVDPVYATRYDAMVVDALTLTKGQLHSRYKAEYTSLRSRIQQAKHRHKIFDDRLKDIRDWLIHLGPRPAEGWTVDRIKGAKGYQPGNLRWATKIQQTRNRKVTQWHQLPDGSRLTTMQLAKHVGLPYLKVYKRLSNGWDIDRLMHGSHLTLKSWNFPRELTKHCQPIYQQRTKFNQYRIDWFIEYLTDVFYNKLEGKLSQFGVAVSKIMGELSQAKADRKQILELEKEIEDRKLANLLIIMDPTIKSELIQPVKKIDAHTMDLSVATEFTAKINQLTLNVMPCQQPLTTPRLQTALPESTIKQKEYNKILNLGLKMPLPTSMEEFEAVIEARTKELEAQGIYPPDPD